jgi:hypothetical protein
MSPPAQLASAAAAAPQQAAAQQASEECSQLWTQLQGLMQQRWVSWQQPVVTPWCVSGTDLLHGSSCCYTHREKAVAVREQQAAQYGQVEELLGALARHVQALLGDQQVSGAAAG